MPRPPTPRPRSSPPSRGTGCPLGEAFQLRDDLLGVFGDPARTGKPAGDDLREGKQTLLVALAMERADPADAAALRTSLGDRSLSDDAVSAVRSILVDTGAVRRVEDRISACLTQALAALQSPVLSDPSREILARLAVAAAERQT